MAKRYFAKKRKNEPKLGTIIAILVVLLGGAYGLLQFADRLDLQGWFGVGGSAEASAVDSIGKARAKLEAGKVNEARDLLDPLVGESGQANPEALLLRAEIAREAGDKDAALGYLARAARPNGAGSLNPDAAVRYARLLEEQGDAGKAVELYQSLRKNAPAEFRAAALAGLGRDAERAEDRVRARDLYEQAVAEAEVESGVWKQALDRLGELNTALFFAPRKTPDAKYYTIEPGDSLTRIGVKLNTTQGSLIRANAIESASLIRPGQRLKYTPKDFRLVIERSTCSIYLFDSEGLFKRYPTGLGMPGYETTLGKYIVGNKQKDPTWYKPGSEPIPPGDPRNELGTRWMPLVPQEEDLPDDLGIHGTIAPETIGKYESHGCPRMLKEDVEELYDLVVRSTPVEIVEKVDWSARS